MKRKWGNVEIVWRRQIYDEVEILVFYSIKCIAGYPYVDEQQIKGEFGSSWMFFSNCQQPLALR